MPWKECNHMDERLRFVARLLDGEKWRSCAGSLVFLARPATKSSIATRISACEADLVFEGLEILASSVG